LQTQICCYIPNHNAQNENFPSISLNINHTKKYFKRKLQLLITSLLYVMYELLVWWVTSIWAACKAGIILHQYEPKPDSPYNFWCWPTIPINL